MTTVAELVSWLPALGIAEAEQALVRDPFDPGATRYRTQPPAAGGYFTLSEFPPDDTGGDPVVVASVWPLRGPVEGDADACYGDGCIVFEADDAGAIRSCYFGENYAGDVIADAQMIPESQAELLQLTEAYRAAFAAYVQSL